MDRSNTDIDVSLSPSKIFDRLQMLRQLQLLQRGKLIKQHLQYKDTSETSSGLTEIVSQFSNSTTYNTFSGLLQSSCDSSTNTTPRPSINNSQQVKEQDLIDGVEALNLSQESEFILTLPLSAASRTSRNEKKTSPSKVTSDMNGISKHVKQISLDEMPILSPKQGFEAMVIEKLKSVQVPKIKHSKEDSELMIRNKKPFLKRGEGMARFGIKKTDLVIQKLQSLPWRKNSLHTRVAHTPKKKKSYKKGDVEILVNEIKKTPSPLNKKNINKSENHVKRKVTDNKIICMESEESSRDCEKMEKEVIPQHRQTDLPSKKLEPKLNLPTEKHPIKVNRGKTWAAVLTKEQDDFLRQLKQSDYYKNFASPAKSSVSDVSCDDFCQLRQAREVAEQNMFELLENKVTNESFNLENSFFNKFLKRSLECSGDSTPMIMQKCLQNNPDLLHIFPSVKDKVNKTQSECSCDYTDVSDACSMTSCCSCQTVHENSTQTSTNEQKKKDTKQKDQINKPKRKEIEKQPKDTCQNDNDKEINEMKANMEEMNAKLVATSELLKDRLQELEDEIETFRKENTNLAKLREEIDLERQKFYEEKNSFEQKFNEEKILSEYYLAEEKEKLNKQKQMYEKYVREIRGRLNKKEKDEVVQLKKEINDLKEEIRNKDAKSTSHIARLRNQLKIMEREKSGLQEEIEKLKKENRRIQHSNEITRRLTNVKYLEEINKKLSHMAKTCHSEVDLDNDVKYKAYEIDRQSRSRRVQPAGKGISRQRAKSVPNLNVTSRYAKYFSQRDAVSHIDKHDNDTSHIVHEQKYCQSDDGTDDGKDLDYPESPNTNLVLNKDDEEYDLEKRYLQRFKSNSPVVNRSEDLTVNNDKLNFNDNVDAFFIRKSNLNQEESKSAIKSLSPHLNGVSNTCRSILSNRSSGRKSPMIEQVLLNHSRDSNNSVSSSKSPASTFDNSYGTQRPTAATVINQAQYKGREINVSPVPTTSNSSNVIKTNLNPTEIIKPDGSKELRFPNGNVKYISADGKYSKFVYYNGDVKEYFYNEGRIKYYYGEAKTYHTTHADGLEILEFPDGQVEKRYKDGSSEIRLPNGSYRYHDPKNEHVREEWRFPDGTALTVSANGEQKIVFGNGQVEVHAQDHKRREFPDGTVKLVYTDGTSETRYASGRVRIKDKHGNLIMDSAPS